MKCFLAYLLIAIYLLSYTPMKEFTKLPYLVSHYSQHIEENPNMSLLDFLDMHYMHGIIMDDDYAQDMQLPFKVMDFSPLPLFVMQENIISIHSFSPETILNKRFIPTIDLFIPSPESKGIFHPPQEV